MGKSWLLKYSSCHAVWRGGIVEEFPLRVTRTSVGFLSRGAGFTCFVFPPLNCGEPGVGVA